jgi:hypothetical protein
MNSTQVLTDNYWDRPTTKPQSPYKRELRYFPFSEFAKDITPETIAETKIAQHSSWILPQLMAYIGQMRLYKTDLGEYDPLAFLDRNLGSDPQLQGMWRVLCRMKRSELVKPQNNTANAQWSLLVPLLLAAVKMYQGVGYSQWSQQGLEYVCEPQLCEAMLVEPELVPELTASEILAIREIGLTTKTTGKVESPQSKWRLTGLADTALGQLPHLAVTMICQTWVAHPTLRTQYMVLDPNDWDGVPEPLITQEPVPAKWTAAHQKWY